MSKTDFASLLANSKRQPPAAPAASSRPDPLPKNKRKHVGGYFSPEVAKRLRVLASEEDTTVQALLTEGLRLMFAKRGIGIL